PLLIADHHGYRNTQGGADVPGHYGNAANSPNWSWTAMILPFVEQKPAYDTLGVSQRRAAEAWALAFGSTPNAQIANVFTSPVALFVCPSDNMPEGGKIKGSQRRCDNGSGTLVNSA